MKSENKLPRKIESVRDRANVIIKACQKAVDEAAYLDDSTKFAFNRVRVAVGSIRKWLKVADFDRYIVDTMEKDATAVLLKTGARLPRNLAEKKIADACKIDFELVTFYAENDADFDVKLADAFGIDPEKVATMTLPGYSAVADVFPNAEALAMEVGEGSGLNAALTAALVQAWRGKWRDKLDELTLIAHHVDNFGWFASCVPTVALNGYRMPKKMVLGSPSLYRETESRRGNERGESRRNDGFDPRKLEQFLAVLFAKYYLEKVSEPNQTNE
jgi:hypothetical protein